MVCIPGHNAMESNRCTNRFSTAANESVLNFLVDVIQSIGAKLYAAFIYLKGFFYLIFKEGLSTLQIIEI